MFHLLSYDHFFEVNPMAKGAKRSVAVSNDHDATMQALTEALFLVGMPASELSPAQRREKRRLMPLHRARRAPFTEAALDAWEKWALARLTER